MFRRSVSRRCVSATLAVAMLCVALPLAAPASAVERGTLVAAHVSVVEAHVFILEPRTFHHSARVNLK